ncbi:MAG: (d)CMP kinase [Deltaproteobacteria bacterium]|jgi:cytidylate kinase|nr:(d)CMP kinase [Deltaproteobacteria bacterium]
MATSIITIDGPAGAGKTTVSKLLSQKLGIIYVDTGAIYRGVAFEIKNQNIEWENDSTLEIFLEGLDLNFIKKNGSLLLISSGRDISKFIRTPEISMLASSSSARPQVRAELLDIQRKIAKTEDAVFEGRDMGTVVFPEAEYKFYLFADLAVRAKRRYDEMPNKVKNINKVEQEMQTRDNNDSQRETAPLKPATDAIKIDSTFLTIEQVVEKMLRIIEKA